MAIGKGFGRALLVGRGNFEAEKVGDGWASDSVRGRVSARMAAAVDEAIQTEVRSRRSSWLSRCSKRGILAAFFRLDGIGWVAGVADEERHCCEEGLWLEFYVNSWYGCCCGDWITLFSDFVRLRYARSWRWVRVFLGGRRRAEAEGTDVLVA